MLDANRESNPITGDQAVDVGVDATSPAFAARVGRLLHDARRARKLRLRHLANDEFSVADLRAVERGTYPLTPLLASQLAATYGADLGALLPRRESLVLLATGTMSAGGMDEYFDPEDLDSVLAAYLRLVGKLRGGAHDVTTLRRDDLGDIADQLGRPRPEIIDRVGELAGATPAQRRAMVALYLAGADVVGIMG